MHTDTPSPNWTRFAGWGGLAAAVVVVVGLGISADAITFLDPPGDIREWVDDNATTMLTFLSVQFVTDIVFFIPFVLAAAVLLERAAPRDWPLARMSLIGGLLQVPLFWIGSAFTAGGLALGKTDAVSDSTLIALLRADAYLFGFVLNLAVALWIGAGGIAIVRSGVVGRWVGWTGVIGALVLLASSLWVIDGDPEGALASASAIGLLAMLIWMIALAVPMIRNTSTAANRTANSRPADRSTDEPAIAR